MTSSQLTEASGLAASRKHSGYLYTHNDHGSGPQIYVISASNGNVAATLTIKGATSHDWEDIAVGPCNNGSSITCIYIGRSSFNNSTVLVLIKLAKFAVALRLRCGSYILIFLHKFILFC